MSKNLRKIVLADGCFWGLEDLFRGLSGVVDTEVGYTGGENENPTYENHPGHAEAIEITFDEDKISYKEILDYFFRIHDPTTKNRQGNDIGPSYRSAIFYKSQQEKDEAREVIELLERSGLYHDHVVTALEPYEHFWPAEEYHQDFLRKQPDGYTCHFERSKHSLLDGQEN